MDPMIYIGLDEKRRIAFKSRMIKKMSALKRSVIVEAYEALLRHLDVSNNELRGTWRIRRLVVRRQIISHILVRRYNATLTEVGRMLKRDHSTILYSCDVADGFLETDRAFKRMYNDAIIYLKSKGFK